MPRSVLLRASFDSYPVKVEWVDEIGQNKPQGRAKCRLRSPPQRQHPATICTLTSAHLSASQLPRRGITMLFRLSSACAAVVTFSLFSLFLQPAIGQSSAVPVEVVYVLTSTLQTYNVNPQTGYATQEGEGITLENTTGGAIVVPSPNDHFLYVTGYNGDEYLWVYATDANGVPEVPPIQTVKLDNDSALSINPDGTLAYIGHATQNSHGEMVDSIYVFEINSTTGMVKEPGTLVATYPPNGPCGSGAEYPGVYLAGFNTNGSQIYDVWSCPYYDTESATYYSRPVNQQTGALGPETEILEWSNTNEGADLVNITPSAALVFNIPNDYNRGINSLSVYPLSGGNSPLFTCSAAMLEACGYAASETADRSGKYVFFQISKNRTEITKLELAEKEIVDTGNYIDGFVMGFSPDDVLVYAQDEASSNPWVFPIYVFDPATGGVSYTGGEISLQSPVDQLIPALRQ